MTIEDEMMRVKRMPNRRSRIPLKRITEVEIKKRSMDDCNEVRELFQSKAEQMEI